MKRFRVLIVPILMSILLVGCGKVAESTGGGNTPQTPKQWSVVGDSISASTIKSTYIFFENNILKVAYVEDSTKCKITSYNATTTTWNNPSSYANVLQGDTANEVHLTVTDGTPYSTYIYNYPSSSYSKIYLEQAENISPRTKYSVNSDDTFPQAVSAYFKYGNVYITYSDPGNSNKLMVKRYSSGFTTIGDSISSGYVYGSSTFVDNNEVWVAYVDGAYSSCATVKKRDTGWRIIGTEGFTEYNIQDISIVVDSGTPYIAFSDAKYSNKLSVMKYSGSSWEYIGAGISSTTAYDTSITSFNGVIFVAYKNGTTGQLSVMKYE